MRNAGCRIRGPCGEEYHAARNEIPGEEHSTWSVYPWSAGRVNPFARVLSDRRATLPRCERRQLSSDFHCVGPSSPQQSA
jgi:hypothetical protein